MRPLGQAGQLHILEHLSGERGEGNPFSPSGGGRRTHGSARISGTACHEQVTPEEDPRTMRAEVARGNPPRSGELCLAGGVSAKKCLSLAVLIRHAARVRRDSGLLEPVVARDARRLAPVNSLGKQKGEHYVLQ